MAIFSFNNPNSSTNYFFIETIPNLEGGFSNAALRGTWGAFYNFTGSTEKSIVESKYTAGYTVPPGSSSFEYNPSEYIPTGSVYFKGIGDFTVSITSELTSSTYTKAQLRGTGSLNTIPLENIFEATWDTTRTTPSSSAASQLVLPLIPAVSGGFYDFTVDWGDSTTSRISSSLQPEVTHSYSIAGTYTTKIWGTIRGWRFSNISTGGGDRNKLQSVNKWGGLQVVPIEGTGNINAFVNCQSASFSNVIGTPDLRYTNSLRQFFYGCSNLTTVKNLEKWDIASVSSLRSIFNSCNNFDQDLSNWDVSNVTSFAFLVNNSFITRDGVTTAPIGKFTNGGNLNIGKWNVSRGNDFTATFQGQPLFDYDLGNWDVSNANNLSFMFAGNGYQFAPGIMSNFNNGGSPSIGNWNTSNAITMANMFTTTKFNQNIGNWDVSKVTNMSGMFAAYFAGTPSMNGTPWQTISSSFNNGGSPSIGNWNTSNVTNMSFMFAGNPVFNQNIGNWDVSKVTNMGTMFSIYNPSPAYTSSLYQFNNGGSPSIGNWNLSSSTDLRIMFRNAGNFNQPIGTWNTSKVTRMDEMFRYANTFDQNIGSWNVTLVTNFTNFMEGKPTGSYSTANYDALLIGWASRPVVASRSINFGTVKYSSAASASRAVLTSAPNNWTIVDGGQI